MGSLRERFQHISALFDTKLLGPEAKLDAIRANIGLLATALGIPLGVVESESTKLAKAKAEIEKSMAWASAWKAAAKHQRAGRHAAAKVAAERIMKCGQLQETVAMYDDQPFWDDLHQLVVHKLREKLAEAKAEIEGLRDERDAARLKLAKWLDTHSQLLADTEIGRLVRELVVEHELDTVAKEC